MTRYKVELSDAVVDVNVEAVDETRFKLTIGDADAIDVQASIDDRYVHLLVGNRSHTVRIGPRADERHVVSDGRSTSVQVLDALEERRRGRVEAGRGSGGIQTIASPMPGRVVKVLVEPGQHVEPGDGIIIVEAMKMENELRAVAAGVVESIEVETGVAVEQNAPLVRIGPLHEE